MDSRDASGLMAQQRRLAARLAARLGRGDAEDLASEALSRGLACPAPDGRQAPWIERIFRNLVIDRVRHHRRAAARIRLCFAGDGGSGSDGAMSTSATPEALLLDAERRRALRQALPALAPPERDALVARFLDEAPYHVVAARAGIPPATARTRVHRGLATLRARLHRLRCLPPVPGLSFPAIATAAIPAAVTAVLVVAPVLRSDRSAPHPIATTVAQVQKAARSRRAAPPAHSDAAPIAPATKDSRASETGSAGTASPRPTPRPARRSSPPATGEPASPPVIHINYGPDEITGDQDRPEGDPVVGDPAPADHPSLIEIPRSFFPAVVKMLDDI